MRAEMLIRSLKWRGVPMWPPEWWISDYGAGDEGVLEEVQLRQDLTPECLYVVAMHFGDVRKGIIVLEEPAHLKILYHKLKENLGRPLAEIGDLDLELLPSLRGPKQARPRRPPRPKAVKKA
jgi:hypothetical protein